MPVPSSIADLSTTAGSNSPAGTEAPSTLDNYQRAHAAFIAQLRAVIGGATDANIPSAWLDSSDKQTSTTDITAGALMSVGAFGLGISGSYTTLNLNTLDYTCFVNVYGTEADAATYNWPQTGLVSTTPVHYAVTTVAAPTGNRIAQYATECYETVPGVRTWVRSKHDTVWTAWVELCITVSPALTGIPTAPTASAGTNTTQLANTAFVKAAVDDAPMVGVGQTWQDVSGSRSASTNYTNNTGKPIMVNIIWYETNNGTGSMVCDGVTVASRKNSGSGPDIVNASMIVPNGRVYSATSSNGFKNWVELR